jgi:hypothetical protein
MKQYIANPKAPALRGLQSTLVLGATALCAANTQAAVVVNNFNRTVTSGWSDGVYFSYDALNQTIVEEGDLNNFNFSAAFWLGKGANFQSENVLYVLANAPFAPGASVGSEATWTTYANFTSGNYVGLQVDQGSGNYNYGYAKYSVNDTSLTLESVAFETEFNTAIVTPIPEPSASLLGLAGGAAALLGIRRRKAA